MGSVVSPHGGFRNWDRPVLALVVSNRSCWQTGPLVGGPGGAFQSPCPIIAEDPVHLLPERLVQGTHPGSTDLPFAWPI